MVGDSESFVFDPRAFITGPYIDCPFCGAGRTFGVLMLGSGTGYSRRCRECMKTKNFRLPALDKKVLYLDQFAVSNLMKVLHADSRRRLEERGQGDFWAELFDRLDRLVKLHVLVCPSSTAHWEESLPTPVYEQLRRMYEHLSGGVDFNDPETIRRAQVHHQFLEWIGDVEAANRPITVRTITNGELNRWLDRLSVQARLGGEADFVDDLAEMRDRSHAGLSRCVERWEAGGRLGFNHYFEHELSIYGPLQWQTYWRRVFKVGAMMNGEEPFDPNVAAATSEAEILIVSFKRDHERRGVGEDETLPKIAKFFASDAIKQTPFLRVSSALFAAMAVEASLHQAPRPDRGMMTDVTTVSTLLPYCDAMFIDNRCHRLLKAATEGAGLVYDASVFSLARRDELVAWLDELEASVSTEHLALVKQVYGDSWLEPYAAMYEPGENNES
jgi:ribosomal protein S18 acetylase RimI-like enzyme